VSLYIPDKSEQIVRYYGWYSNKSRGLRKKDKPASLTISPRDEDLTHYQKKCRAEWVRLIRKIYEVDPLSPVSASYEDRRLHRGGFRYPDDTDAPVVMGNQYPLTSTLL